MKKILTYFFVLCLALPVEAAFAGSLADAKENTSLSSLKKRKKKKKGQKGRTKPPKRNH